MASNSGRWPLLLLGVLQVELFVLNQVQLPTYKELLLLRAALGVWLALLLGVGILDVAELLGVEGLVYFDTESVMAG